MEYNVILKTFEGPLDLLLHLIEKNEVDIYDIPIAEITEQYISYLGDMKVLDLEITSEFLVMAATLLEIKSKMLLPKKVNEGQQLEMEEVDPRQELVRRLIEYKKYKQAAEQLKSKEEAQKKVYFKPREELEQFFFDNEEVALEGIDLLDLIKTFKKIMKKKKINSEIDIKEIERDEITIEECIERIRRIIFIKQKVTFEELFDDSTNKISVVVTFLSILELIKLKEIKIRQETNFGDIIIIRNKP